jgi:hypothetical protein
MAKIYNSVFYSKSNKYIKKVLDYYHNIDIENMEKMYLLFSESIVYQRCEQEIKGVKQFKKFYNRQRKIKGEHVICNIFYSKNQVIANGYFQGINKYKDKINLSFADFFEFDSNLKISKRYTYLASGFDLTK